MLTFLERYGRNYVYSQNGEEGVIEEIARRLGMRQGEAVEIGGHDGRFCSNTALLAESGWRVLFVEMEYGLYQRCCENWRAWPNVRSQCSCVDSRNVNAFVGAHCDLLSIDLDGSDFQVFTGLEARPKIVIVEIDSSIPPDRDEFNADGGAGYWPMTVAALERGYFLLAHTGNLIFLRQEYGSLFPEIDKHPLLDYECFFNKAWLK